jgi:hypothetical protein
MSGVQALGEDRASGPLCVGDYMHAQHPPGGGPPAGDQEPFRQPERPQESRVDSFLSDLDMLPNVFDLLM